MEREFAKALLPASEQHLFLECMRLVEDPVIMHVDGAILFEVCQRWSGEPGTSIFNGMWNLFNSFLCWTLDGKPADEFFFIENISDHLVEGDDALNFGSSASNFAVSTARLGMGLKMVEQPSILHASFLGRYHGIDASGKFRSMADVIRSLRKWHLSASPSEEQSCAQLMFAKSLAYMATDYHSPLLGAVAWSWMQRTKEQVAWVLLSRERTHSLAQSDVPIESMLNSPPPPFDWCLAATYTYWTGIPMFRLAQLHEQFVAFGRGADHPPRLALSEPKEGAEHLIPV